MKYTISAGILLYALAGCTISGDVTGPEEGQQKKWAWDVHPLGTSGGWQGGDCEDSFVECYDTPPEPYDDMEAGSSLPTCNPLPTQKHELAWCNGYAPTGAYLTAINDALQRMRNTSPECEELADAAAALISTGGFRIYTQTASHDFGGAAPQGGDWAIIAHYWVTQWAGANLTNDGRNLASTIAHEMDHHLANTSYPTLTDLNGHLKVNGSIRPEHTLNSQACAV